MPRPKKPRCISQDIEFRRYAPELTVPTGVSELPLEGIEAIRLCDCEGLDHEQAAAQMGVSRQTYGRILAEARSVVAHALVYGRRLCIVGGAYRIGTEGGRRTRRRRRGGI